MYDQFTKQTKETNDNYGLPYEYGSVMHYGSKSYSADKTRWHTMIPVDKMYIDTLGSQFVSFYNKLMMNTHYNCLDRCKSHYSAKCAMGGFPNPKDCLRCVCPGGYGGRLCNKRPSGCGEILQATTDYKKFEDIVGHSWVKKSDDNDFFAMCKYWIEAPLDRKVEVKFHNFTDRVAVQGCYYAGVEIKSQKDQVAPDIGFALLLIREKCLKLKAMLYLSLPGAGSGQSRQNYGIEWFREVYKEHANSDDLLSRLQSRSCTVDYRMKKKVI